MEESSNLVVKLAGPGDTLIKVSSQEKIVSVQKKHTNEFVYNFTVQGSHTYFANDYLVHNIKTTDGGDGGFWQDIFDLFSW